MTQLYLASLPDLPSDYTHVMNFTSETSQRQYFISKASLTLNQNFQADSFLTELLLNTPITSIRPHDYLFFQGTDGKWVYYFILTKDQHTQSTTRVGLQLDVFSTYQFDIQFLPSNIERCHVPRWNNGQPSVEVVPEPVGESDKIVIHQQSQPNDKGCYLYASVNPLGKVGYRPTSGSGGGNGGNGGNTGTGGCGNPDLGIPSPNGFLFLKGYEGLAQYAYDIGDGRMTVGYGCTDLGDGENYTYLHANEPVDDRLASEVMANSVVENYGIPLINQLESDGIQVSPQEFDALLDFVYNAGLGSLINATFYQSLKEGNKSIACEQWLTTNILQGSQFETGLRARRQAEVNIFLQGQYELRTVVMYGQGGAVVGSFEADGSHVPDLIANECVQSGFVNQATQDDLGNVWQFPVSGIISATFPAYPDGSFHAGIDIAGNDGLKIRSSGIGTVYQVGYDADGYGNYVVVQMENGQRHWFGHMKYNPVVIEGQSVNHQTILGIVGSTGNSTGPHVHWEIRQSPYAYDLTCLIHPSPQTQVGDVIEGVGD